MLEKRLLSLAPMMSYTHRHFRFFIRLLSKQTTLYTEMVTPAAILRGKKFNLLNFDPAEKPVVLQLGGDNPQQLAETAKIGADLGYDEINFNVGCPSDKVQLGNFGACLMQTPETVADCINEMKSKVNIPITIKHRLGTDKINDFESLCRFVQINHQAGCHRFIVHARIAILQGLSPKDNRKIPPIQYDKVYELKKKFPDLNIELNGEVKTIAEIQNHLQHCDGVMIGRASYENPFLYATVDQEIFHLNEVAPSRAQVMQQFLEYAELQMAQGVPASLLFGPTLQLYHRLTDAKRYRQKMSLWLPRYKNDFTALKNQMTSEFGSSLLLQ